MKKLLLLKSLFLLCALVVGTNAWATDETIEITYSDITKTGYDASETTFDKSEITFGYVNMAKNNANGTPTGWASNQVIQTKASTGVFYNKTAITGLKNVRVYVVVNTNSFKIYSGTTAQPTTNEVTRPTTATGSESITYSSYAKPTVTPGQTTTATYYDFPITSGNKYFKIANGSNAIYIWKIVLTYESTSGSTVATPTFSPVAGAVASGTEVTITCATEGATIHYTTDGNDPTSSSTTYDPDNKPTITESNTTIKAIGIKDGLTNSAVATASYTIALPPVVTLDFASNEWGISVNPTKTVDATEFTKDGYTITLKGSSGNGYYFDTNNIMLGKSGATLTLPAFGFNVSKIKVYGADGAASDVKFNIFVGSTAVSTEVTSSKEDHEFAINSGYQDVGTIYIIKVSNDKNMRISKIEIYGNGCEAGLVQSYGWATYIPAADVEYPANTAYVVTDASVSTGLTLAEVTQVPSGTPLLLKGVGAKTAIKLDVTPSDPATNLLTVSDGSALSAGSYPYVLAKNGESACFKQWTGAMSSLNGRVMLVLDETAAARAMFDLDENDVTAIEAVKTKNVENGQFFNLAGQRVANPTKGLYIVNGKKVVIK